MFIVIITYKKPISEVDKYLNEHRIFLDNSYDNNFFVASGPKNPRTGGIIISHLENRQHLDSILEKDPFYTNEIADYEIIEFSPTKYHPLFAKFLFQGCL